VDWLLRDFAVIDGTNSPPFRGDVLIRGGVIAGVAAAGQLPVPGSASLVLNGRGSWLTPGLINCHEHLLNKEMHDLSPGLETRAWRMDLRSRPAGYQALVSARNARRVLQQGVTTVREMAGPHVDDIRDPPFTNIDLRDAIKDGLDGPRVLACRLAVSMTGGHGYPWYATRPADGCDEARKAVREQLKGGADFIKVMASAGLANFPHEDPLCDELSVAEMEVIVEEAHRRRKLVAAHALSDHAARKAVSAGVDSIEHGFFLGTDTLRLMREKGTALVPTVMVATRLADVRTDALGELLRGALPGHREVVRSALQQGIPVGVGTDSRFTMAEEMVALLEYGLSPGEVLNAATAAAARICGLHRVGTLEEGNAADLVVLGSNPLEDLGRAFRDVRIVIRDGVVQVPSCASSKLVEEVCSELLSSSKAG